MLLAQAAASAPAVGEIVGHVFNVAEHVVLVVCGLVAMLVLFRARGFVVETIRRAESAPIVDERVWEAIRRRPDAFRAVGAQVWADEVRGNAETRAGFANLSAQHETTLRVLEGQGSLIQEMTRAVDACTDATSGLRRLCEELDARDRQRGEHVAALLARFDDLREMLRGPR